MEHGGVATTHKVLVEESSGERLPPGGPGKSRMGETHRGIMGLAQLRHHTGADLVDFPMSIEQRDVIEDLDDRRAGERLLRPFPPTRVGEENIRVDPGDVVVFVGDGFDRQIEQPLLLPEGVLRGIAQQLNGVRHMKRAVVRELDRG